MRIVLCLFALIGLLYSQEIEGKVIKIYDCDTLNIIHKGKKERVRLFGIDSPELKQDFGIESRNNLRKLCKLNTTARVEVKDIDRYKRIVGIVYCNGIEVNANQVKNGFAWAYRDYSKQYIKTENYARNLKRGLWKMKNPIEPRIWRKNNLKEQR